MKLDQIDSVEQTAREWRNEAIAAELITSDFIPVNMWMVRYIGLDATLFMSAAYEEFLFLRGKKKNYTNNSIIFSTRKAQQKTGLGSNRQKNAIEVLKKHRLIDCHVENGIPKKRIITFYFGCFNSFEHDLKEFITEDLNSTKIKRTKFNDRMEHIRNATRQAHYNATKINWEEQHPGHNFEEWLAGRDRI